MSRKAFHISVDFDVHAVTCPGVWLCPKGVVMLRVAMFGLSENTKTIRPCFPLLFHERFRFRKLLKSVSSLSCLQEVLKFRNLHMQLVHLANGPSCCPATVLATFKSPLVDVFYPSPSDRGLNVGVDVDLLLNPTTAFPGIISPKVEISTRVVIEEVINYPSPQEESWIVNPITVISKKSDCNKQDDLPINRQRAVCHTEGAGDTDISDSHVCCCYNKKKQKSNGKKQDGEKRQKPPFVTGKFKSFGKPGSTHDNMGKQRYIVKERVKPKMHGEKIDEASKDKLPLSSQPCNCYTLKKTEGAAICDCMLCKKYRDYFPRNDSVTSSSSDDDCLYSCGDSPEVNRKGKYCKTKKKSENIKKRSPLKINEQKRKFLQETQEPFKPSLPKPTIKQIQQRPQSPHGNVQSGGPVCDHNCQRNGISEFDSDISRNKMTCYLNSSCKVKSDAISDNHKEDKCKCGIYSCTEWLRSKNGKPPTVSHNLPMNATKFSIMQKKSHRQIFYSNLEDYYRKLYERAKEHSAVEEVQACA